MIRAMQLWTFINLTGVKMPVHFNIFMLGNLMVSQMDVLDMEEYYDRYLEFKHTEPLTEKFGFFEFGDMNFVNNSGSFLALIVILICNFVLKYIINKICLLFP